MRFYFYLLIAAFVSAVHGESLTVASIFSDHMVLQQERPVPVWGTAEAGAEVTVDFAGQKKESVADDDGKWQVTLDPMPASSAPRKLTVFCNHQSEVINRKFSDVLVGEVWFCSGQSNMEWPLVRTENAQEAIKAADYPEIRLYDTPRLASREPVDTINAEWKVCSPETVSGFSGVAYYFGRKLHRDLNVPVGLILSAWGATRIEAWTPPIGFKGIESLGTEYRQALRVPPLSGNPGKDRNVTTALYNGMLAAHIPFAIRGAIWYQGEQNRFDGMAYLDKTKALLKGWRTLWGHEFPFYLVQIAPFHCKDNPPEILPEFWEAQSEIVKQIPHTGMAVISDVATTNNIHPPNKVAPGERLALLAEANTYGMDVVSVGPVFRSLEEADGRLVVKFDSAEGLTTRDGEAPDWFEIAGEAGVFKPAQAQISGESVVLSSPEVSNPEAVRFAWHKLAVPNLMNGAGLPASAFRAGTDN